MFIIPEDGLKSGSIHCLIGNKPLLYFSGLYDSRPHFLHYNYSQNPLIMATYLKQVRNLDVGQSHLHRPPQPWTVSSISLPLNLLGDEDIASQEQNTTSIATMEAVAPSTPRSRFSLFSKHRTSKANKADSVTRISSKAEFVTKNSNLDVGSHQSQCTFEPQATRPARSSFRSSFASFLDILRFKNGLVHRRSSTFHTSKPAFIFSSVDGLSTMTDPSPHSLEQFISNSSSNNNTTSLHPLPPLPLSPTPSKFKSKHSPHVSSLGLKSLPPPPRPKRPSYKPVRSPQQYKDSGVTRTQGYYPLFLANDGHFRTISDTPLASSGSTKKKRSMYTQHVERAKTIHHHQHTQEIIPPWTNTAKPLSRIMTTPSKSSRPQLEGRQLFEYDAMPLQLLNSPSDTEPKQVVLISPQELLQQQRLILRHTYLNGYGNKSNTSTNTNSEKRMVEKKPSFGSYGTRTVQSTRLLGGDPSRHAATRIASRKDDNDKNSVCPSNAENGGDKSHEETTNNNSNVSSKTAVLKSEDMTFELVKPLDLNRIQAQRARRAKATFSAYIRHRSLKATVSHDVDIRK